MAAPAFVGLLAAFTSASVGDDLRRRARHVRGARLHFTPASRRWRGTRHEVGWLGPLAAPGMRTVFPVMATFGTALGAVQVAVPAFADEHGSAASGGVLLAGLSIGSMAGGFIYGARTWPGRPGARLVVTLLGAAVTFALLALAGSRPALALLLVLVGLLAGPVGRDLLDAAGHGRPARHDDRGVRGDGDGHRHRHRDRPGARRDGRRVRSRSRRRCCWRARWRRAVPRWHWRAGARSRSLAP